MRKQRSWNPGITAVLPQNLDGSMSDCPRNGQQSVNQTQFTKVIAGSGAHPVDWEIHQERKQMVRFLRFATNLAACAALLLSSGNAFASGGNTGGGGTAGGGTAGGGGTVFAGLSLSVSNEVAPAGSLAQMKVLLTEPQPIKTGAGSFNLTGFSSVSGIAVMGPLPDVNGVAVVRGSTVTISVISPSGTYGTTNVGYPILTVAGRVNAAAAPGTIFPISFDGTQFLNLTGTAYPVEIKPGTLTVGTGVAIGDVLPGSAVVPAGGIVRILGANFLPNTTIKFATGNISQLRYISPNEIDAVAATSLTMHGMQIKAQNPDKSQSTYYSYQRTYPVSLSSDPLMQFVMPLFSPVSVSTASFSLPAPSPDFVTMYGVALQNLGTTDASSTVELLDATGNPVAVSTLTVSPSHYIVRELGELFGFVPDGVSGVRVTSSTPIQVMGVLADELFGNATPILAH